MVTTVHVLTSQGPLEQGQLRLRARQELACPSLPGKICQSRPPWGVRGAGMGALTLGVGLVRDGWAPAPPHALWGPIHQVPGDPRGCLLLALLSGIRLVFHKNRMWWVRGSVRSFLSRLFFQELNVWLWPGLPCPHPPPPPGVWGQRCLLLSGCFFSV